MADVPRTFYSAAQAGREKWTPSKLLAGNNFIPETEIVKGTLTWLVQAFSCHYITFSPSLFAWVPADIQMGIFPLGTYPRAFISLP